jgi:hypothetical protein
MTRKKISTRRRPASVNERVARYRANLRKAGLKPIQIWVPDTSAPGFAEECRRQSRSLRNDPPEQEIMDWIEQVADREGWEWEG